MAAFIGCYNWKKIEIISDEEIYIIDNNIVYTLDGKTLVACPTGITGDFTIPDTVEKIKGDAFCDSHLENIIISDNITVIEAYAFETADVQELVIGKNVTSIGQHAFINCSSLKKVTIKNNSISGAPFGGCKNWTEIEVDSENEKYKVEDNVLYTKDGKTLVLVPKGRTGEFIVNDMVETIIGDVFTNTSITSVVISDSVTTISAYAFVGSGVQQVTIGKNVRNIGQHAFLNCNTLTTVLIDSETVAKALTSQTACCYLINKAETIYIKDDITEIGSYVLENYTPTDSDKEGYIKYAK